MKQMLAMCSFGMVDQHRFAQLSGNTNPMHLDPVRARRALFGEPVVHGIHLLLRTLDEWLCARPPAFASPIVLRRLRGRFPNPTYLDFPVEIELLSEEQGHVKLQATSRGAPVLHLELDWDYASERGIRPPRDVTAGDLLREPRDLALHEIEGMDGTLPLFCDLQELTLEFPDLSRQLGCRQLADLLACTRLVGMECPGLHSILASLDLEERKPEPLDDDFHYHALEVTAQFSLVRLEVSGLGFQGRIQAFRSPQATPPMSFEEIRRFVEDGEFADQIALVVGGSRGLGAMAAKLVAAGGGWPIATYYRGESDALELAREIRAGGARCDVLSCDVASPGRAFNWLDAQGIAPTHLYYLASPRIHAQRSSREYSRDLYQRFAAAYVDGFTALLLACQHRRPQGIKAFYPSSVAVATPVPGLAEFADAKRAGETLCRDFDQADIPIRIRVARLPRIDTDQSASLIREPAANPLDVMLHELRRVEELE